ncbi:hypothetical protein ITP53_11385 [Nonomuraea sp. K274]|uniref:Uncharacterized protein n=1 Tax=Nonomuraea cypriaca TaxID=1187855 RepID=A0A931A4V8_9ACTN|nr:hypothetical protein [Nonomuraea cypriaca]MBF8186341.1 hypothetical protein [Nonomuraea cypriaca]
MRHPIEPITLADAAERLDVNRSTLGVWAHRYRARRLLRTGRSAYYDFWDLAAIELCLRTGRRVPTTAHERDELRQAA